jgi:hypothetical protein
MKRLVILLLTFLPSILSAQTIEKGLMDEFRFNKLLDYTNSNSAIYANIQGTPYLEEDFVKGTVLTTDSILYSDVPLRYNRFDDELEFQKYDKTYVIDPKSILKRAEFGGIVLTCAEYMIKEKSANGFFQVITEGRAVLYIKHSIKFVKKEAEKAFVGAKPARFDYPDETYYISVDGNPAIKVTGNKNFCQLFSGKESEIETYCKKEKISNKNLNDLKRAVEYYNSLMD